MSAEHEEAKETDAAATGEEAREEEARAAEAGIDEDKPLYVISVAAELVDMHPQTLRLYERKGLIEPSRSAGKTRLYSQRNIEQLREIRRLTQELGVNLAGVEEIIKLRRRLDEIQASMENRISNLQLQLKDHFDVMRRQALPAGARTEVAQQDEEEDGDADEEGAADEDAGVPEEERAG